MGAATRNPLREGDTGKASVNRGRFAAQTRPDGDSLDVQVLPAGFRRDGAWLHIPTQKARYVIDALAPDAPRYLMTADSGDVLYNRVVDGGLASYHVSHHADSAGAFSTDEYAAAVAEVSRWAEDLIDDVDQEPDNLPAIADYAYLEAQHDDYEEPEDLDEVEDDPLIESLRQLSDPRMAHDQCRVVSEFLLENLDHDGVRAEMVQGVTWSGQRLDHHFALLVRLREDSPAVILDLTFNQVEPSAPWPLVTTAEDWVSRTNGTADTPIR